MTMTWQQFTDEIDRTKADNVAHYGDWGFDFQVKFDDYNTVCEIVVTWPGLGETTIEDAHRFGEALQAFAFAGNRFIGTEVVE